ncbi:globin domain-containing protein [Amycolatopsis sp. TRM77291]
MLSPASAAVVRATLPVVRAHAVEITGEFYSSMFAAHPELLDLFNQGNQADGRQKLALASAVAGFAEHLLDGDDAAPFERVAERIAHKHVSLGIRAEQYPLVGHYLLTAVGTVLGAAVTPEVSAAWHEVYWLLACRLIAAEARLYERGDHDPADLWRRWRVAKRLDEAVDVVSFTLVPDDGPAVPDFLPGQYVSVAVDLPDGRRQPRQYSLSQGPGRGSLRITVRRVRGHDGAPDGAVSNHLHDHVVGLDLEGVGGQEPVEERGELFPYLVVGDVADGGGQFLPGPDQCGVGVGEQHRGELEQPGPVGTLHKGLLGRGHERPPAGSMVRPSLPSPRRANRLRRPGRTCRSSVTRWNRSAVAAGSVIPGPPVQSSEQSEVDAACASSAAASLA